MDCWYFGKVHEEHPKTNMTLENKLSSGSFRETFALVLFFLHLFFSCFRGHITHKFYSTWSLMHHILRIFFILYASFFSLDNTYMFLCAPSVKSKDLLIYVLMRQVTYGLLQRKLVHVLSSIIKHLHLPLLFRCDICFNFIVVVSSSFHYSIAQIYLCNTKVVSYLDV